MGRKESVPCNSWGAQQKLQEARSQAVIFWVWLRDRASSDTQPQSRQRGRSDSRELLVRKLRLVRKGRKDTGPS